MSNKREAGGEREERLPNSDAHPRSCRCMERGQDGTLAHSESSGILCVGRTGTKLIPCLNHLKNYLSATWEVERKWSGR